MNLIKNKNNFYSVIFILSYFIMLSMFYNVLWLAIINILFIIFFVINIKNDNKKISKNFLLNLVAIICYSIIACNLKDNSSGISLTLLFCIQLFLIISCFDFCSDKKLVITNIINWFVLITKILVIYSIVVWFFGNKFQIYNSSTNTYIQYLNVGGFRFIQSSIGGDIPGKYNVGSLFSNPNGMSYTCLFALVMLIFTSKRKIIKLIEFIIIFLGIYLSGSRLALILVPFSFLLKWFLDFIKKNNKIKPFLFFWVFIILLLIIVYLPQLLSSIELNGRYERWVIGIKNISFLGGGMGYDDAILEKSFGITTSMHNSYISFLVNFGIFGFILFLAYLIRIFKIGFNKLKVFNINLLLVLFIIILISSLSEYMIFSVGSYNMIFMLITHIIQGGNNEIFS